MALLQRDDSLAADWLTILGIAASGRPEKALQRAEELYAEASDPFQAAQAAVARAVMLYNTGNRAAVLPLLKPIEEQLHDAAHPRLIGEYHILLARIAYDGGSYGLALMRITNAERALERMSEHTRAAAYAWGDLAITYSRLGYHPQAVHAITRSHALSAEIGQPQDIATASLASVHAAVYLDQRGDTDECVRQLTNLVEHARQHINELAAVDQVSLRYAIRRLAALDHPIALDLPAAHDVGPLLSHLNTLGDICDALAARRPDHALALLDAASTALDLLGTAEPIRLRSLALAQRGDLAGALATAQALLRIASQEERELRTLLVDSVHVRIDQDKLRQTAEQQTRAALTDPLTGLPNRRKLDEFTGSLTTAGEKAAIGMLDLDRFKAINDNHGHPTGDMVLQRVAGILAREVRPNDLLARSGGDEFVIVLPDTTRSDAETLGEQIEAAVRNEDWSRIVPNILVAISTGWAEIETDVDTAYRAADTALYETKRKRRTTQNA
jgi:diguanylate cyclase (GGDEF)-like protein